MWWVNSAPPCVLLTCSFDPSGFHEMTTHMIVLWHALPEPEQVFEARRLTVLGGGWLSHDRLVQPLLG